MGPRFQNYWTKDYVWLEGTVEIVLVGLFDGIFMFGLSDRWFMLFQTVSNIPIELQYQNTVLLLYISGIVLTLIRSKVGFLCKTWHHNPKYQYCGLLPDQDIKIWVCTHYEM